MEEISKKELLIETGISYGQLYRWKREGLIPEEWFIKRSAFTGQETFFPRERMLARVQAILALKDTCSLDEIRDSITDGNTVLRIREALVSMSDMDDHFVDGLSSLAEIAELSIDSLAAVIGLYEIASRAEVEREETQRLVNDALAAVAGSTHLPSIVTLTRINGAWHFIISAKATWIAADREVSFVGTIQVGDVAERLRRSMPDLPRDVEAKD